MGIYNLKLKIILMFVCSHIMYHRRTYDVIEQMLRFPQSRQLSHNEDAIGMAG